jgi:hypothetical protein
MNKDTRDALKLAAVLIAGMSVLIVVLLGMAGLL